MAEPRRAFIERLLARHCASEAFLRRRLRSRADTADFVREVYLRMLRVSDPGRVATGCRVDVAGQDEPPQAVDARASVAVQPLRARNHRG